MTTGIQAKVTLTTRDLTTGIQAYVMNTDSIYLPATAQFDIL